MSSITQPNEGDLIQFANGFRLLKTDYKWGNARTSATEMNHEVLLLLRCLEYKDFKNVAEITGKTIINYGIAKNYHHDLADRRYFLVMNAKGPDDFEIFWVESDIRDVRSL